MTRIAILGAGPLMADQAPNPVLQTNTNSIWFGNWVGLSNAMLRVAAPDGTIETIYETSRAPSYRLSGTRVDGAYRFELRAATSERVPYDSSLPALGDAKDRPTTLAVPFYMTGAFLVKNGAVVPPASGN